MEKYPCTRLINPVQIKDELGMDSDTGFMADWPPSFHQHIHSLNTKLSCG